MQHSQKNNDSSIILWLDMYFFSTQNEKKSTIQAVLTENNGKAAETATGSVLWKKVFLKISQNSPENICEFCKIFKNTFFPEQVWTTAFELDILQIKVSY